jgi:hypothetical protein
MPLVALFGLVHLGIARFLFVLGRGRGGDDGGIDNRALTHQQPALGQHCRYLIEHHPGQPVLLQPVAEVQHRRRVGHRIAVQIDAGKAAQRLAVIKRILDRLVGQPVPLLHKVDPKHALQPDWRPAALALRIEGVETLHQPRPRHHLLHLGQKLVASRRLFLAGVLRLQKASLPLHRPAPRSPRTRQFYPMRAPKNSTYFSVSLTRHALPRWTPNSSTGSGRTELGGPVCDAPSMHTEGMTPFDACSILTRHRAELPSN